MQTFFQQLINGLSLGSIYALLALGYMIVYGISKLLNFAHGDVYMLGAYWGYYTINYLHFGFITALITAMIVCGLAGVIIEAVAYRPLRNAPRVAALITAIGVSFFLENGMSYLVTSDTRNFPQVIKRKTFDLGGVTISNIQLIILVTTLILTLGLMYIINYTKTGRAMRSVSTDYDAASLMGININHTVSITFALGSALAGAAGVLIGLYYNSIDPLMGMTPGDQGLRCRRARRDRVHPRRGCRRLLDRSSGNGCPVHGLLSLQRRGRLHRFDCYPACPAGRSVWQEAS